MLTLTSAFPLMLCHTKELNSSLVEYFKKKRKKKKERKKEKDQKKGKKKMKKGKKEKMKKGKRGKKEKKRSLTQSDSHHKGKS